MGRMVRRCRKWKRGVMGGRSRSGDSGHLEFLLTHDVNEQCDQNQPWVVEKADNPHDQSDFFSNGYRFFCGPKMIAPPSAEVGSKDSAAIEREGWEKIEKCHGHIDGQKGVEEGQKGPLTQVSDRGQNESENDIDDRAAYCDPKFRARTDSDLFDFSDTPKREECDASNPYPEVASYETVSEFVERDTTKQSAQQGEGPESLSDSSSESGQEGESTYEKEKESMNSDLNSKWMSESQGIAEK